MVATPAKYFDNFNKYNLTKSYVESKKKLSTTNQEQVDNKTKLFIDNPSHPSFVTKKIRGSKSPNIWRAKYTKDLRMIYQIDDDYIHLLYVDLRNDALEWGQNVVVTNNTINNVSVFTQDAYSQQPVVEEEKISLLAFENIDNYLLIQAGVPSNFLNKIKSITVGQIPELTERLPQSVISKLCEIIDEHPVIFDKKYSNYAKKPDIKSPFLATNINTWGIALNSTWNDWKVYLPPELHKYVDKEFSGPSKISGPAGTGQTIIGVHRAVKLTKKSHNNTVLLTTPIQHKIPRLNEMVETLTKPSRIPRNLEIISVNHLVQKFRDKFEERYTLLKQNEIKNLITKEYLKFPNLDFELNFVISEWETVIDYWGINELHKYIAKSKSLQSKSLTKTQLKSIWNIIENTLCEQKANNLITYPQLCRKVTKYLTENPTYKYNHLIVDDYQDLTAFELQCLRNIVDISKDDITLIGDGGQIHDSNEYSWEEIGINIENRSFLLNTNYRTTEEIFQLGTLVLSRGNHNEYIESSNSTIKSIVKGMKPEIISCDNEQEELNILIEWINNLIYCKSSPILPEEIAVFARSQQILNKIVTKDQLSQNNIRRFDIKDNKFNKSGSVNFGTMDKATGLEFKAVAVIGCANSVVPDNSILNGPDNAFEYKLQKERNLFYTVLTRPRDHLLVTYTRNITTFLI